ncbi:MAG TPA: hypothetical protein VG052_05710, partial [Puia sp.]|nr:hypothetical protein [Puia sp.]
FDKMKKSFDANSNRTKTDVDAYNKAVKDINNSANAFNQTNAKLNSGRTQTVNEWSATEKSFTDQHMPHYR